VRWLRHARFVLLVGLIWAGLRYIVLPTGVNLGPRHPLVLTATARGLFDVPLFFLVCGAGAYLSARWLRPRNIYVAVLPALIALVLWPCTTGTMDDWLKFYNESVTQSPAGAYWRLLGEYAVLLVAVAVMFIAARAGLDRTGLRAALRTGLPLAAVTAPVGLPSALVLTAAAWVLMLVLTGPRTGWTYRGQVYFAVVAAFWLGLYLARQVLRSGAPGWYLLAPFAVGVGGLIYAGLNPRLPAPYQNINIIPAIGVVRALPLEMVALGLATIAWSLRSLPVQRPDSDSR
jgi:hypothetical protein